MKKYIFTLALIPLLLAVMVFADEGSKRYLDFPHDYKATFSHYHTMNRAGEKLVAKMYANQRALDSLKKKETTEAGSVIVMEVYKPVFDNNETPVKEDSGIYRIDKLAAIAVMEKKESWPSGFPGKELLGDWGFTIFKTDMTPTHKNNSEDNINCVSCHTPLKDIQDSLFSYKKLIEFAKEGIK